jgi:hypothetical protein
MKKKDRLEAIVSLCTLHREDHPEEWVGPYLDEIVRLASGEGIVEQIDLGEEPRLVVYASKTDNNILVARIEDEDELLRIYFRSESPDNDGRVLDDYNRRELSGSVGIDVSTPRMSLDS